MKNIKVSEVVYDKIDAERKGGETFDDALRRVLGLFPEIDDLVAYLPDKIREFGREIVDVIDGLGNFKKEIERDEIFDKLHFIDKGSGISIARVDYGEENFIIYYRDKNGDMRNLTGVANEQAYRNAVRDLKRKVPGAIRKWGK